jgi:hypothetical protein
LLREVKDLFTGSARERGHVRLGRWISLLPILALIPRLGLIVIAADRQTVAAETRAALLWISSGSLAALVGCAEVYVGVAVVSRRHGGLALVWAGITLLLNALIVPLSISGLEAIPVWEILSSRALRLAWGSGLGLLSTLCVGGCLWADVVREVAMPTGTEEDFQARSEARWSALEEKLGALHRDAERAASAAAAAPRPMRTEHAACPHCGYWSPDQRRVAGHVLHCRRRTERVATAADSQEAASESSTPGMQGTLPA